MGIMGCPPEQTIRTTRSRSMATDGAFLLLQLSIRVIKACRPKTLHHKAAFGMTPAQAPLAPSKANRHTQDPSRPVNHTQGMSLGSMADT